MNYDITACAHGAARLAQGGNMEYGSFQAEEFGDLQRLVDGLFYDRQSLCDQLNSALAAHGWGAVYGTVE